MDADWWMMGSAFTRMLLGAGLKILDPKDPFIWTTNLDGVLGDNDDWYAAGMALLWYCHAKLPDQRVNIIAHSHGGQIALYAAAHGLLIDSLVTIATPVRRDVQRYAARPGRPNIERWTHLYSDTSDLWQWLGSWFDGSWRGRRSMPLADLNIQEPGVGHTGLLNPVLWKKRGWDKSFFHPDAPA
jgi:pimeloyl-ACP methyl ester carboxylesterase